MSATTSHDLAGAGKEGQEDEQRDCVAEDVAQVLMQERHRRDPDQPDQAAGDHAEPVERGEGQAEEEHGPDGTNERKDAVKFLGDRVRRVAHRPLRLQDRRRAVRVTGRRNVMDRQGIIPGRPSTREGPVDIGMTPRVSRPDRPAPRRSFREHQRRELLRHVRVIGPMRRPAPRGLNRLSSHGEILEPAQEELPDVALRRRQRSAIGKMFHARPGERELDRPALAPAGWIVQNPVDVDGRPEPRKVPVEERPPRARGWVPHQK